MFLKFSLKDSLRIRKTYQDTNEHVENWIAFFWIYAVFFGFTLFFFEISAKAFGLFFGLIFGLFFGLIFGFTVVFLD